MVHFMGFLFYSPNPTQPTWLRLLSLYVGLGLAGNTLRPCLIGDIIYISLAIFRYCVLPPSSLREGGKMDPFAKFRSTHSQPSRLVVRFSVDSFFSLIFATSSQNRPTLSPNERGKLSIMLCLYPLTNRRAYRFELFAATPEDIVSYSPSPWDRCTAAWRVSNTFLIYVHKMCTHE